MRWLILIFALTIMATSPVSADNHLITTSIPLDAPICSGHFIAHDLDHITNVNTHPIRTFDSNGAGVAVNDLNRDGLLDVVFANLDGPVTILWNEGQNHFRKQILNIVRTRDVKIIDVDSDGRPDLVFTTQTNPPIALRNNGDGTFVEIHLSGVDFPAYSMDWGDVQGDGHLSLVTGSYDAELGKVQQNAFLFSNGAGVNIYRFVDGQSVHQRLSRPAQALVSMFIDWQNTGHPGIAIGNDFATPDQFWTQKNSQWIAVEPFSTITQSTMSFATGDLRNNGSEAIFATDMNPYHGEGNSLAWLPVLRQVMSQPQAGKITHQSNRNKLQVPLQNGFRDAATDYGVTASGWSWSAQFGDLNNDGYLDLYIVNGMIAQDLFPSLPNGELVEANQAFRSIRGIRLSAVPEWKLGSTRSGRGMVMADLNNDGQLDIVINNLDTPAQYFENQICGGDALEVELHRTDVPNTQALDTTLILHTSTGNYQRTVHAASGYLSGVPSRQHFGFPVSSQLKTLEIRWPDGRIDMLSQQSHNQLLSVTRGN